MSLSDAEIALLKKGLNYATNIPATKIITKVKTAIKQLNTEQADTVRRAVNSILQQAEPLEPNHSLFHKTSLYLFYNCHVYVPMILEIGIFMFLIKAKFLLRLINFFTLCYWTDHTILLLMLQVNQSIYRTLKRKILMWINIFTISIK